MDIKKFILEGVRCFDTRQELAVRPLTFLVGENSTGKTTALGCFHALANRWNCNDKINFNTDTNSMGAFENIVRRSRPKRDSFKLGFALELTGGEDIEWVVEFAEDETGLALVVRSLTISFNDGVIVLRSDNKEDNGWEEIDYPFKISSYHKRQSRYEIICKDRILNRANINYILHFLSQNRGKKGSDEKWQTLNTYLRSKKGGWHHFGRTTRGEVISVHGEPPTRSSPERNYDPVKTLGSREVPVHLMQMKLAQKSAWESLQQKLSGFGCKSALFEDIEVKSAKPSINSTFQLHTKIRGSRANIADVGYGVSQVLPILVSILDTPRNAHPFLRETSFALLQQPEIHLHPRAQAELASVLAGLASRGNKYFIIETHSDYMIDRTRIEIKRGNIKPEDVSLLYFEPKNRAVKVHNLTFDKLANMMNTPAGYRDFFMREYRALMGFEDN